MSTAYHAKYFAAELTKRCPSDSVEKLASSLADAQVDLNPHQIEAALFAFRSPLSKGAILADEVGLGKTVEAGLVISQKWAERKRKILVITPANLRKQWSLELAEKFFLPSIFLESKSFNQAIAAGNFNPFSVNNIVICSYQFARSKEHYIAGIAWDLVVIDEAHRLRNVYKPSNKIANAIRNAVSAAPKILLTATPLQNSLLELYGLVSIIDDFVFGDLNSFRQQFGKLSGLDDLSELRARLTPVCIRTLRRQVLEYIPYTNRIAIVEEFVPAQDEQHLYDLVSEYLQRDQLFALPKSQRKLMTLILRKLLASSTFAIAGTLEALASRLEDELAETIPTDMPVEGVAADIEHLDELADEWKEDEEEEDVATSPKAQLDPEEIAAIKKEIGELKNFASLAKGVTENSKGLSLLAALRNGFAKQRSTGAPPKALIFTESTRTQQYLLRVLENAEYRGKVVLFNGSNTDPHSKSIYEDWLKKHAGTDRITGSSSADKRAALVEHFRDTATIMIATEAAAEGVNLQFCSLVVNYDLPWNPQRIEQRIGRCHRYGQKYDVVVVNFLNKNNEADQRVYQILAHKFQLFEGVFGASDEVLGVIGSGVDFEKRIAEIYQRCRTPEEIQEHFNLLQQEMEGQIDATLATTRQQLLENFDEEVNEKLRVTRDESLLALNKFESWLWELTRFYLRGFAEFSEDGRSFTLQRSPFSPDEISPEQIHPGPYRTGKHVEDANLYRIGHPLAQRILKKCAALEVPVADVNFFYSQSAKKISILEPLIGHAGWLQLRRITVSSFEDEDTILLSGITDRGEPLEEEQCRRLFSLQAEVADSNLTLPPEFSTLVEQTNKSRESEIVATQAERNSIIFENEMEKLDLWAADVKGGLEDEIKDLDKEIRALKKEVKLISDLEQKIELHRRVKELERRRNERRKSLYEMQDQIDAKKEDLLAITEEKLKQRISREELFTIRWGLI